MKSHLIPLLAGELQRMLKYGIIGAGILVSLIWIVVLQFTEFTDMDTMLTTLLFVEATSMSILWMGVTLFFEKDEGSLRSMLVTPVSRRDHLLAKTIGNGAPIALALVILYLYAYLLRDLGLGFLPLLAAVILASVFHSLVGLHLTFRSKSFTGLLMNMMKYMFVCVLPVILDHFGAFRNDMVSRALYLIPTKASMSLITASLGGLEPWEIWFSIAYLAVGSGVLLWLGLRRFDDFAAKEGGG